jgi:hypothetical protein
MNRIRCWRISQYLLLLLLFLPAAAVLPAGAQDQPTIVKDSVRFTPFTSTCSSCKGNVLRWWPKVSFRVNGPIAAGSQLHVEVFPPAGGKPWKAFDCNTGAVEAGSWWKVEDCGKGESEEDKGVFYTGLIQFKIGIRNEVLGTDVNLFTGKAKVGKTTPPYPTDAGSFLYYADYDWHIPIGVVYLAPGHGVPDSFPPVLYAEVWLRGKDPNPNSLHVFYQGKEVAKEKGCTSDTYGTDDSRTKTNWSKVTCEFRYVYRNRPNEQDMSADAPVQDLSKNPGEYEIKMLYKGELARSMKFTVAAEGSLDNGSATANKMGDNITLVPVKVIGAQDGVWDRLAWKTGAFFGNPLTGFTAPP